MIRLYKTKVEETEVEARGLMENTSYTVVALAVNSGGEESERAFSTFRTEIDTKTIALLVKFATEAAAKNAGAAPAQNSN